MLLENAMFDGFLRDFGRAIEMKRHGEWTDVPPREHLSRQDSVHALEATLRAGNPFLGASSPDASAYVWRGHLFLNRGDLAKALGEFDKAIKLDPHDELAYVAYLERGLIDGTLENYENALIDYDRAIELRPEYPEAYLLRGQVYDFLDEHEEAIADYTKAIELKPGFANAYAHRGFALEALGESRQAIEDWKVAADMGDERAAGILRRKGYLRCEITI
jgi:tetratricopeptide (TPR) repeat protein